MLSAWSFASLVLAVVVLGGEFALGKDSAEVATVKDIIQFINDYLDDHYLTEIKLPDLGYLPTDPIKLTYGRLGELDTLVLQDDPVINNRTNRDGSITYTFNIKVGLDDFHVNYKFHVGIFALTIIDGSFTLRSRDNSLQTSGIVVVKTDGSCDSNMKSAKVVRLDDFETSIKPYDIPFVDKISDVIMDYLYPKLLPIVNLVLEGAVLTPQFQKHFSELTCNQIPQTTTQPTTTTEPTTTEPITTTELTTTQPTTTTKSTTRQPKTTQPTTTTEPTTTQPTTTEPTTIGPTTTQPTTTTEPTTIGPTTMQPTTTQPTM